MMPNQVVYRRDIDGLRAVAVLLVLFYHVGFQWMPGGFIGVDVFFVISGFLITGVLKREIESGHFQIKKFYLRRIRRLIPAMAVVIFASILLFRTFYLPDDYYFSNKSALYALLGISNFLFLNESKNYFAVDVDELPFLHTWSLGVEEQFYVFWPLLVFLLLRFTTKNTLVFWVSFLFFAFFGLSIWMSQVHPGAAYFLLPARAFELMMGSALSLLMIRLPDIRQGSATIISVIGMALIVASSLMLTSSDVFPGINAFWPCLGTVLLIVSGSDATEKSGLINRWLGTKIFVGLGLISYSLYLWHWPPIAVLHYLDIDMTLSISLGIIGLSISLAWLTWRFVELPFRQTYVWGFGRTLLTVYLVPVFLVLGLHMYLKETDGAGSESRFPEDLRGIVEVLSSKPSQLFKDCYHGANDKFETGEQCLFGDVTNKHSPDFVLLGDSHANSARGFIEVLAKDAGLVGLEITKGGTPFLLDTNFSSPEGVSTGDGIAQRRDAIKRYLEDFEGAVVLVGNWSAYLREDSLIFDPVLETALPQTVASILGNGHQMIIFKEVPELENKSGALCVIKTRQFSIQHDCAVSREKVSNDQNEINNIFLEVKKTHASVLWIDPKDVLCDQQQCYSTIDGTPFYQDESHLNYLGAKALGEQYLLEFSNPLRQIRRL